MAPPPTDAILDAAMREAQAFFAFPDRVHTPEQRAQVLALTHKIAVRRGWAPVDLVTGLPRDTTALLARADAALASIEGVLATRSSSVEPR